METNEGPQDATCAPPPEMVERRQVLDALEQARTDDREWDSLDKRLVTWLVDYNQFASRRYRVGVSRWRPAG